MWYVIQVPTGREEQLMEEAKRYQVQECFDRIFTPYSVKMKKYLGEWHLCREPLFPGYVFVISSQPEELYQALKRIPRLTRLLGTGENWTHMSQEDIDTVHRLAGPTASQEWLTDFSRGYVQNGIITITEGPLKGLEPQIRKIDRHKRTAWLEVELMGEKREVRVGVEIVTKE